VRDVVYARDTVKALLSVTRYAQLLIWAVAIVLLVAAALLILNTIRMAIYARRREVSVMKLVGATNWFIRVPFMFEGLVQGLIGAVGAFGVVFLVRNFAQNAVRHVELFRQFSVNTGEVVGTGLFLVIVGMVVGAVGSAIAVSRFLDV
jgi:cell division transport system permease protein